MGFVFQHDCEDLCHLLGLSHSSLGDVAVTAAGREFISGVYNSQVLCAVQTAAGGEMGSKEAKAFT